ncbi:hypothetical protein L204_100929 [Cryptococcus depauperatus]|nr:hypothetical protein L204_01138 [Cryptococcus depauperatus CBS 7855]
MAFSSQSPIQLDGNPFKHFYPNGFAQPSVSDQQISFSDTTKAAHMMAPKHAFNIPKYEDRLQIWIEEGDLDPIDHPNENNIENQTFVSNFASGRPSPTSSKFSPQPGFFPCPTDIDPSCMTEQSDLAYLFCQLGHVAPFPQIQSQNNNFLNLQDLSCQSINPDELKRKIFINDDGHKSKRRGITVLDQDERFVLQNPTVQYSAVATPNAELNDTGKSPSPTSKAGNSPSNDEKTCTARPKSVVPEKFLNDGSAEAALGMPIAEIQSFPSFEELLKKVHPDNYQKARAFGEKITKNRDKAKHAAKRSRDQRRAKIERAEILEKQTEELQGQIEGMKTLLSQLVKSGAISRETVQAYI